VLNIIGTAGADAVTFNSGSVILGSTINDAGVESLTFNTGGGADALAINDASVALAASGKVSSLTLNPNATLDLRDRSLVIDYTGNSALAATTASITTARNGGQWNLPGIITSQTLAKLPSWQATLGVAEASDVVNFAGHATAVWNGQTVDQTAVLIRYTFAGDANLDGVINGDDYFLIDAHAVVGGYHNGDFDYSSNVNADDYFLIDSNYNKAQTPLAALAMARAGPALPPAIAVAFPQSPPAEHKLLDELL
jgi:hypothetical protein